MYYIMVYIFLNIRDILDLMRPTNTHTHTHTHMYMYADTYIYMYIHVCVYIYVLYYDIYTAEALARETRETKNKKYHNRPNECSAKFVLLEDNGVVTRRSLSRPRCCGRFTSPGRPCAPVQIELWTGLQYV